MKISKAIFTLALAAAILPGTAFAATHDAAEDISSDTATVTVGKILTVNQNGKFPNINDFSFEIEAVTGWDNANASSQSSGSAISASAMPKPAAQAADHHKVTVSGSKALVTVGDFKSGTASRADGGVPDTAREKLRTTDVSFKFTKAGYYMYKVTEKGSAPGDVPGVTYDDNSYYIVVYVCNKTDASGNTIGGVYVHNITSWRNAAGDDTRPDLSDIANKTDNGGAAPSANTSGNYDKVGSSRPSKGTDADGNPAGPDKLAAYRFWNEQNTHDVVITNNVTGNLGDRSKDFEYEITLTGLEKGVTYTTNVATAETTPQSTSAGADLVSASKGTVNTSAKTITSDGTGAVTMLVRLKDDEKFVINALPRTAGYAVNEKASDHVASYAVTSDSDEAAIARESASNTRDKTALSTAAEIVDADDGTVTIAFTNNRNLSTPTGVPSDAVPAAGVAVIAAGVYAAVRRRRTGVGE